MTPYRILIVEDDTDINFLLQKLLESNGYSTTCAFSGSEAKLVLAHERFDLLLLDLMLPGIEGEPLIAMVRETCTVPIIVISAKLGSDARVAALRLGADDFIPKPFDHEEVLARVEAQLRRIHVFDRAVPEERTVYRHKNCVLDTQSISVKVNGQSVDLTAREYQLFLVFLQHPERVFTRNTLFSLCWGQAYVGTDNTVDVHISRIRGKLAAFDDEEYIRTVRGIGYRLSP